MRSPHPDRPSLDAKVAFLREPASYPEPTWRVEARETHMSWVFLLDEHVYKLKKPVRYPMLDFSTVAARRYFCEEEVRLNLRLAPDVYLGVVPLTFNRQHHLALGGSGVAIDWLVKMRRLPSNRMLDYAILHGGLDDEALLRLTKTLLGFYRSLPAEPVGVAEYRSRFESQARATLRELTLAAYELSPARVEPVCSAQLAALGRIGCLLDERVHAGRIVEGHGDLRPEHVCLGERPAIIDCLEFSRGLRIVDSADELGFLGLECERLGAGAVGRSLMHRYNLLSGDTPPAALVHFYQSCRASTRALISARHLLDEKFRHSPHWVRRANQYLDLAEAHISKCHRAVHDEADVSGSEEGG